jgi:hypothetical protein
MTYHSFQFLDAQKTSENQLIISSLSISFHLKCQDSTYPELPEPDPDGPRDPLGFQDSGLDQRIQPPRSSTLSLLHRLD